MNILSKFQLPSSNGLGFMISWRLGGKGSVTEWINRSINNEAVCRTAPATWHVKWDTQNVTCDMWHLTPDTWHFSFSFPLSVFFVVVFFGIGYTIRTRSDIQCLEYVIFLLNFYFVITKFLEIFSFFLQPSHFSKNLAFFAKILSYLNLQILVKSVFFYPIHNFFYQWWQCFCNLGSISHTKKNIILPKKNIT